MTTAEEEEGLEKFKSLMSESMVIGAEAASVQQLHAAEAQAWDLYVCRLAPLYIERGGGLVDAAAAADVLLVERRKRFNLESHRASILAAKPPKAELRSIR